MYLDVKTRLSNKFWARHLADTVAMCLKFNSTPPLGRWQLQNRGFTKTRTAPRLSDQCPEGLASQNTISNAGELGVRQSQETRENPILGTTTSSSPHPPRSAKAGHHKADWLAHISQNLLDTSPCCGRGTEGDAGTDATFNNPRHSRHLYSGGHHGKAICADSCRQALRREI